MRKPFAQKGSQMTIAAMLDAAAMLDTFCRAVERREGRKLAALFTEDGVYHDVFYGAFAGRPAIAKLVDDNFYRTARDFRWDMHDPVSDGKTLYARYSFSYVSTLPEAAGKRVGFAGVAIMSLRENMIASYREIANVGPALVALNFAPARVCKILGKEGGALMRDPDMARHFS
ncbi:MAG: nuclear transport factor 2 family protein [Rhodoblastus sp.]